MTDTIDVVKYCLLATCLSLGWYLAYQRSNTHKLSIIPTVGPSGMLTSYWGALHTLLYYNKAVQTGYAKYRGGMFKIPIIDRWLVLVTGPELISELSRAPEKELSMSAATAESMQGFHTMGMMKDGWDTHFQDDVVRHALTKNIGEKFPEVVDEVSRAFADTVAEHTKANGWAAIPALNTLAYLVARISNRYFLDEDLCRNKEFTDVSVNYSVRAFLASVKINMFPSILRPIVGPLFSPFNSSMKQAGKYLIPIVEDRLEKERKYGRNYSGKPNDLITWLLDAAPEKFRTPQDITHRTLLIHLAAIHTSSNTMTNVLFVLASRLDLIAPLREEVEAVTSKLGWTKEAIDNLYKLDSFIRESQRCNGLSSITMQRIVTKPEGFTFSNGVTVPRGTMLAVPDHVIHSDTDNFENADEFDAFRWLQEDGTSREAMTKVGVNCVNFGAGRHSCPGRFFATAELKAMFAHILNTYDIKLDGDSNMKPKNITFGSMISPHPTAKILLRKREN